jgi:neogenin
VKSQNAVITGYKIRYRRKGRRHSCSMSAPGNRRMFVIAELDRGTEYQVKLLALNANGKGPFTDWLSVTTLDSDLDESQVPHPPHSLRGNSFILKSQIMRDNIY